MHTPVYARLSSWNVDPETTSMKQQGLAGGKHGFLTVRNLITCCVLFILCQTATRARYAQVLRYSPLIWSCCQQVSRCTIIECIMHLVSLKIAQLVIWCGFPNMASPTFGIPLLWKHHIICSSLSTMSGELQEFYLLGLTHLPNSSTYLTNLLDSTWHCFVKRIMIDSSSWLLPPGCCH